MNEQVYASHVPALFPQPNQVQWHKQKFSFNQQTKIMFNHRLAKTVAKQFYDFLSVPTGYQNKLIEHSDKIKSNKIFFLVDSEIKHPEGYQLKVNQDHIVLRASTQQGLFWGSQTLRQLFDKEIESRMPINKREWLVQAATINDQPRFGHRGMHLDVSRHFYPVEFVKRYIDWLAFHKMNVFQWHLTDDQGWRMEIKKYPKLTSIGGYRKHTVQGHTYDYLPSYDNTPVQGFYTQEQIKDVIEYARDRHVEIIPEIDVPGHSTAIIAAYPEFSCHGTTVEVEAHFGIFEEVLCPTEQTFAFLNDVYREVAELFPSQYIHIGGDEVIKKQWLESTFVEELMKEQGIKTGEEVQSYFIARVAKIIKSLDKELVGWNEIMEGGLAKDAIIMSWTGVEGGIEAAKMGHKAIMSPYEFTYLDAYQSRSVAEPKAIHGYLPIKKAYLYDPAPNTLAPEVQQLIIGAQGALWTEYIKSARHAEYMVFPRLSALAESFWTDTENKNWQRFSGVLPSIIKRYQAMGINTSLSAATPYIESKRQSGTRFIVTLSTELQKANIYFTTDGSEPNINSELYQQPFEIGASSTIKAIAYHPALNQFSAVSHRTIDIHKGLNATVTVNGERSKYEKLNNGERWIDQYYDVNEYAVFYGTDMEAKYEFDKPQSISQISIGIDAGRHRQLHPPKSVTLYFLNKKGEWQKVDNLDVHGITTPELTIKTKPIVTQAIKVVLVNANNSTDPQIPKLPLYVDEIVIH